MSLVQISRLGAQHNRTVVSQLNSACKPSCYGRLSWSMVAHPASSVTRPASSQLPQQTGSVKARVRYVKPPPPGKVLQSHVYEQADGSKSDNLIHVPTEVTVSDIRELPHQTFDLLVNGFSLVNFNVPQDIDWETDDKVF